ERDPRERQIAEDVPDVREAAARRRAAGDEAEVEPKPGRQTPGQPRVGNGPSPLPLPSFAAANAIRSASRNAGIAHATYDVPRRARSTTPSRLRAATHAKSRLAGTTKIVATRSSAAVWPRAILNCVSQSGAWEKRPW